MAGDRLVKKISVLLTNPTAWRLDRKKPTLEDSEGILDSSGTGVGYDHRLCKGFDNGGGKGDGGRKRGRDSFYAAPGPRPTSEAIKSRRIRVASPFAPCGAVLPEQEMKVIGHHAVSQKVVRASEIICSNPVKCGWFSKT
jgi:hypothetical protein